MIINPDEITFWTLGDVSINATIVYTWVIILLLTVLSWSVTRNLSDTEHVSRWQTCLEVVVMGIRDQIQEVSRQAPGPFLPFVGTLFLFIATANLLSPVPGYQAPTGSLSTTAALALCVLIAVPLYGIARRGPINYLKSYTRPTVFMLPFNIMGEVSRTIALAVRLYGNVMSGTIIAAILISLIPFFFPVIMQVLGLLTGMIQAYIFAILAMVYIASATQNDASEDTDAQQN